MNPSAHNNEQQGDLSWSTENWDNPSTVSTLDLASRQYSSASRLEWEWDPMILAQHPGSGGSTADDGHDGVRMKNQLSTGTMSSLRASYSMNMLSAGLPSNFTQNPMGIFSSAGIRNYGTLDGSAQHSTSSNLHGVQGTSGIPGLAATSGAGLDNDIRSFDHSRRELLLTGMHDHVKREEVYDGHARIGLNLGVRTYFSTEETAANRLGKRHRTGSPGSQVPTCQAEGCKADLSTSKQYHRRHKVCELHSKAPNVLVGGQTQRFCQQCSRFHSLEEFDDGKRSCRKRLADHNRRRRKPQPYASVSAGKPAESTEIKSEDDPSGSNRANDSKSMIIPLKRRSSPSSVSLEDSDEKPGSIGNSLHFLPSNQGFRRNPGDNKNSSHSGMQMSAHAMKRSEAFPSAISPAPLVLQNAKHQMPMVEENDNIDQDHSVYQQHLQTVSRGQSSGPKLSLSSLGNQLGLSHRAAGRSHTISGQMYNEIETPVPWLRPLSSRSDLTQVIGRQSTMNLQHLMSNDSKIGIISTSANSQEHDLQVFPSSSQNLISRDIASPEWMLGNMTGQAGRAGSNPFSSSLTSITGNGQLESGHQIMPLIDSSNHGGRIPSNGGSNPTRHRGHTPVKFVQPHNTGADPESRSDDNNSLGGGSAVGSPDMKYHELHALRPYEGVPSSIYDAHHNLL